MRSVSGPRPEELIRFSRLVTLHRHLLVPLLGGAGVFAVLTVGMVFAALLGPMRASWIVLSRGALLLTASLPLAFLLVPAFEVRTAGVYVGGTALAMLTTAVASAVIGRWVRRPSLLVLHLLTVAALALDLLTGGDRIAASLLSDFPLTGFRFYGIGNEYMALLVGAAAVGLPWAAEGQRSVVWCLAAWGVLFFLIGSPTHGADFGGALTALGAFGLTGVLAWGERRPAPLVLAACLVAALLVCAVGLFVIDALRPVESRTHLGQLASEMARRGPRQGLLLLGEVASRKWSMNLRLLTSIYSVGALTAAGPPLAVIYLRSRPRLERLLSARPGLRAGILGALAGGVLGFLVNDSGIAVWGLTTAVPVSVLLDLMLEDRGNDKLRYEDHGA